MFSIFEAASSHRFKMFSKNIIIDFYRTIYMKISIVLSFVKRFVSGSKMSGSSLHIESSIGPSGLAFGDYQIFYVSPSRRKEKGM